MGTETGDLHHRDCNIKSHSHHSQPLKSLSLHLEEGENRFSFFTGEGEIESI